MRYDKNMTGKEEVEKAERTRKAGMGYSDKSGKKARKDKKEGQKMDE